MKSLSMLSQGQHSVVEEITTTGAMRRRFQELGIVPGTDIACLQKSFFGDIVAYLIKGTVIAIRNEDADGILIY